MSQFTKRNQKSGANMNFYSKLSVFAVAISLLFVGCKDNPANTGDTAKDKPETLLKVVNDVDERTTDLSSNNKVKLNSKNHTAAIGFEALKQVQPPNVGNPGGTIGARYLHYDSQTDRMYVGYKVRDTTLTEPGTNIRGGGVDILDASNPGQLNSRNTSLQSEVLDVYAITKTSSYLWLATAAEEDETSLVNAAAIVRVSTSNGLPQTNNNNPVTAYADVSGNLVKDIVEAPAGNTGNHEIFAINDADSLFRFSTESDITSYQGNTKQEQGASFRAMTATPSYTSVFLHTNSNLTQFYQGSFVDPKLSNFPNTGKGSTDGTSVIAGITSQSFPNYSTKEFILAARGAGGFAVVQPKNGADVVTYKDDPTANEGVMTSIATTEDYVYVTQGSEIFVYEVRSSGLENSNNLDEGLRKLGTFNIDQVDYNGNDVNGSGDDQINNLKAITIGGTNYLYLAKSDDGLIVLKQTQGELFN